MKMKTMVATGLVFMLPAMVQAADCNGIATLGYSKADISGVPENFSAATLDFNIVFDLRNGFFHRG